MDREAWHAAVHGVAKSDWATELTCLPRAHALFVEIYCMRHMVQQKRNQLKCMAGPGDVNANTGTWENFLEERVIVKAWRWDLEWKIRAREKRERVCCRLQNVWINDVEENGLFKNGRKFSMTHKWALRNQKECAATDKTKNVGGGFNIPAQCVITFQAAYTVSDVTSEEEEAPWVCAPWVISVVEILCWQCLSLAVFPSDLWKNKPWICV